MCALLEIDNPNQPYVLIINSHFSCCDNDDNRQEQVDELVQVLREWILYGDGPFDLPDNTPIFHTIFILVLMFFGMCFGSVLVPFGLHVGGIWIPKSYFCAPFSAESDAPRRRKSSLA